MKVQLLNTVKNIEAKDQKLLVLSNFSFCHIVFKSRRSAADVSLKCVYKRERVKEMKPVDMEGCFVWELVGDHFDTVENGVI